jgi:hypothetical protein
MSTILLPWELGGGLGHFVNLLPLARELSQRGNRVFAAIKDLSLAEGVFAGLDLRYLQAPVKTGRNTRTIEPPRSFAHILHNNGFGDLGELHAMAMARRNSRP